MAQMVSSLRCDVQRIRIAAWFAVGAMLLLWVAGAETLQAGQTNSSAPGREVARDLDMIHAAEQAGMDPLKLGRSWAKLASDYEDSMELQRSETAYNRALQILEKIPEARVDYAIVLDNLGSMYVMAGDFKEAERCRRLSMAAREKLGDPLEIARGKSHLAEVHLGSHKYHEAEKESREAYDSMVAAKDPDANDLISTLVTLIYSECRRDGCAGALEHARTASTLAQQVFAADSLPVGQAHLALGYAEWKAGMKEGPDEEMREGILIMKERTSPSHPYVLGALEQYQAYLESARRKEEARKIAAEVTRIEGARQGQCLSCTVSVYGLLGR